MNHYLQNRTLFAPQIYKRPSLNLGIIVVIPAYDEPFLLLSLMNLKKCTLPLCDVEVIVLINDSEKDSVAVRERNQAIANQARKWAYENSKMRLRFFVLYRPELPKKHAGVGLARKIGMDEACWRFEKIRNPNGVIVCFDADSKCEPNYLQAIYEHFQAHPKSAACSIHFEHPLDGANHPKSVYNAIVKYELHLRYYINAQRYAGFPLAYQTIGSSMAVRARAYQQQGGMNKRQAGEDFYFLHKFIALGNFTELKTTTVIPSPRPSHRVPFGTGRAIGQIVKEGSNTYLTYSPKSFQLLKTFFEAVPSFYKMELELSNWPSSLADFLLQQNAPEKLVEIRANVASARSFKKRFFHWFNAFMLMKFLHFAREVYPDVEVEEAAAWLLREVGLLDEEGMESKGLLGQYREWDRGGGQ
ncbi:MAG: glycosyltransferase family 2 protein [Bacteroidota bacterium]